MEPVSAVTGGTLAKVGLDPPARGPAARPDAPAERRDLDPAVSIELGAAPTGRDAAEERRFVRDFDSKALVFQVTDPVSGDVIVQIPDEIVIKARAYARQPDPPTGAHVEKSV